MPPKTPDITDAQHIVARKLMLNTEAELLDAREFSPERDNAHACGRNHTACNILVTGHIVNGRIRDVRRVSEERRRSFVAVRNIERNAITAAKDGLPRAGGIP